MCWCPTPDHYHPYSLRFIASVYIQWYYIKNKKYIQQDGFCCTGGAVAGHSALPFFFCWQCCLHYHELVHHIVVYEYMSMYELVPQKNEGFIDDFIGYTAYIIQLEEFWNKSTHHFLLFSRRKTSALGGLSHLPLLGCFWIFFICSSA